MKNDKSLGAGRSIVLALLAMAAVFCGVDAMLSESVTTPAKFGGDQRVHGVDTVFVGIGWILMGLSIASNIFMRRYGARLATITAVALAMTGLFFWLIVV